MTEYLWVLRFGIVDDEPENATVHTYRTGGAALACACEWAQGELNWTITHEGDEIAVDAYDIEHLTAFGLNEDDNRYDAVADDQFFELRRRRVID